MKYLFSFVLASVLLTSCNAESESNLTTVKVTYTTNSGDVKPVTDTPFTVMPSCFEGNPNNNLPETYVNYIRLTESNDATTYRTSSEGTFTVSLASGTYCISNMWVPDYSTESWYNHSGNNTVGSCFLSYKTNRSFPSESTIELQNSDLYRASC